MSEQCSGCGKPLRESRTPGVCDRCGYDRREPAVRPGHVIAADLRLRLSEGEGPWLGIKHLCPNCGRFVLQLEDAWCWECNHPGEAERQEREATKRACRAAREGMPAYLRAKGFPEEAARWEKRLEGGGDAG